MNSPLVSIVTPVYNSSQHIEACIDSVMRQSYSNFEMIMVDDASSDNSISIIKQKIKDDHRFKIYSFTENKGAAHARNKAIELAKGKYISFLDSDDLWLPNKLSSQVEFMEKNKVLFSFSSYDVINEKGEKQTTFIIPQTELSYHDLLKTCSIGCLTAIYNQEVLGKQYMKLIRKRQDYTLWLSLLKLTKAIGLKESLAQYRIAENSLSGNKWSAAKFQWKVYREIENLSLFKSTYYFIQYALHGFLKYRN